MLIGRGGENLSSRYEMCFLSELHKTNRLWQRTEYLNEVSDPLTS